MKNSREKHFKCVFKCLSREEKIYPRALNKFIYSLISSFIHILPQKIKLQVFCIDHHWLSFLMIWDLKLLTWRQIFVRNNLSSKGCVCLVRILCSVRIMIFEAGERERKYVIKQILVFSWGILYKILTFLKGISIFIWFFHYSPNLWYITSVTFIIAYNQQTFKFFIDSNPVVFLLSLSFASVILKIPRFWNSD